MTDAMIMNPLHFGSDLADIRINPEIRIQIRITFAWDYGLRGGLRSLGTV